MVRKAYGSGAVLVVLFQTKFYPEGSFYCPGRGAEQDSNYLSDLPR